PGLAEILTNPLYAGRVIRHKGKSDEEERPARFPAPIEPELFERVQVIRAERRTRHPGGVVRRRPYPLARLMRCIGCGSTYHGDANNDRRRIRHALRPACGPSATYRAERFEEQLATLFDRVRLSDADIGQVLRAMRGSTAAPATADPDAVAAGRAELQARLAAGAISLEAFSRAWRQLDRPRTAKPTPPDELRLRQARRQLSEFGTLWRNPAVPDQLREDALREILGQVDVDGPQIVAVHPAPNENAWLLGLVAVREGRLTTQREVGLVGARGLEAEVTSESALRHSA
ncbi:MAG: recombinase family protein, partial [Candidatus Limnocylindrales bacterium]